MHRDSLELEKIDVTAKYLPEKYFRMTRDDLNVQSIAISHEDPLQIFVGTNTGLFSSKDYGKTWTQLHDGLKDNNIQTIAISPNNPSVIYVGTSKGIYLSEDGGIHWTDWFEESAGLGNIDIVDIKIHPQNPEVIYAGTKDGVYISEDGGEMWEPSLIGKKHNEEFEVRFVEISSKGKSIFTGNFKGVYKKNLDEGEWEQKWEKVVPVPNSLLSLDTDPEFIYLATQKGIYKSFNRGITWVQDATLKDIPVKKIISDPQNPSTLFAVTKDNLFYTKNGGDSWKKLFKKSSNYQTLNYVHTYRNSPKESLYLFLGTSTNLVYSGNKGEQWLTTSLASSIEEKAGGHKSMDLVKLMTEIHTGRFFGDYVYLLVDVATIGLIFLVFSGISLELYRRKIARSKLVQEKLTEDKAVDTIINIKETADDLSVESHEIHDMIEHINTHLAKCKTVYLTKEKKEIEKIGKHITTIDKKMHHLMERIEEFDKIANNEV